MSSQILYRYINIPIWSEGWAIGGMSDRTEYLSLMIASVVRIPVVAQRCQWGKSAEIRSSSHSFQPEPGRYPVTSYSELDLPGISVAVPVCSPLERCVLVSFSRPSWDYLMINYPILTNTQLFNCCEVLGISIGRREFEGNFWSRYDLVGRNA